MNTNRYQQNNNNNNARQWSQRSNQPPYSRPYQPPPKRQILEGELRGWENELVELEESIDAAYEKGQNLAAEIQQHESGRAVAVGVAIISAFGVRLPPVAREWQYRKARLDDQMLRLKNSCADLAAKRRALAIKIQRTRDAINDLQFES